MLSLINAINKIYININNIACVNININNINVNVFIDIYCQSLSQSLTSHWTICH